MQEIEFKISDVFDILRKYYYIIISCSIVFTVFAFICNYYIFDKVYESSTTLYTWNSSEKSDSSSAYRDMVFYDRLVNDYKQLIESKRVKNAVLQALKVKYTVYQALTHNRGKGNLNYTIIVKLKRNTRMIKISCQSNNPKMACRAANTTATIFIDTINSMMGMDNIKIIDLAEVSSEHIKPKAARNTLIALFLGICAGFAIGFILKILDNTVKTPEDVSENFKIPLLGIIPEVAMQSKSKLFQRTAHIRKYNIVSSDNVNTPFAESVKIIRNNIQYSSPDNPLKVIMITSANPEAGKTTLTGNLALAIAMSGKKILVIDCDLRKPSLHLVFGIKNEYGLVDCLIHKRSSKDCIQQAVLNGVDVMTSGAIPPNPSELLMSETFKNAIGILEKEYDYILLDAPPAAINLADSAIIGRVTDGVLFVMRAGYSRYDLANHAIEQLLQVNGNKIIGLVLNRFALKNTKYACNYYTK